MKKFNLHNYIKLNNLLKIADERDDFFKKDVERSHTPKEYIDENLTPEDYEKLKNDKIDQNSPVAMAKWVATNAYYGNEEIPEIFLSNKPELFQQIKLQQDENKRPVSNIHLKQFLSDFSSTQPEKTTINPEEITENNKKINILNILKITDSIKEYKDILTGEDGIYKENAQENMESAIGKFFIPNTNDDMIDFRFLLVLYKDSRKALCSYKPFFERIKDSQNILNTYYDEVIKSQSGKLYDTFVKRINADTLLNSLMENTSPTEKNSFEYAALFCLSNNIKSKYPQITTSLIKGILEVSKFLKKKNVEKFNRISLNQEFGESSSLGNMISNNDVERIREQAPKEETKEERDKTIKELKKIFSEKTNKFKEISHSVIHSYDNELFKYQKEIFKDKDDIFKDTGKLLSNSEYKLYQENQQKNLRNKLLKPAHGNSYISVSDLLQTYGASLESFTRDVLSNNNSAYQKSIKENKKKLNKDTDKIEDYVTHFKDKIGTVYLEGKTPEERKNAENVVAEDLLRMTVKVRSNSVSTRTKQLYAIKKDILEKSTVGYILPKIKDVVLTDVQRTSVIMKLNGVIKTVKSIENEIKGKNEKLTKENIKNAVLSKLEKFPIEKNGKTVFVKVVMVPGVPNEKIIDDQFIEIAINSDTDSIKKRLESNENLPFLKDFTIDDNFIKSTIQFPETVDGLKNSFSIDYGFELEENNARDINNYIDFVKKYKVNHPNANSLEIWEKARDYFKDNLLIDRIPESAINNISPSVSIVSNAINYLINKIPNFPIGKNEQIDKTLNTISSNLFKIEKNLEDEGKETSISNIKEKVLLKLGDKKIISDMSNEAVVDDELIKHLIHDRDIKQLEFNKIVEDINLKSGSSKDQSDFKQKLWPQIFPFIIDNIDRLIKENKIGPDAVRFFVNTVGIHKSYIHPSPYEHGVSVEGVSIIRKFENACLQLNWNSKKLKNILTDKFPIQKNQNVDFNKLTNDKVVDFKKNLFTLMSFDQFYTLLWPNNDENSEEEKRQFEKLFNMAKGARYPLQMKKLRKYYGDTSNFKDNNTSDEEFAQQNKDIEKWLDIIDKRRNKGNKDLYPGISIAKAIARLIKYAENLYNFNKTIKIKKHSNNKLIYASYEHSLNKEKKYLLNCFI